MKGIEMCDQRRLNIISKEIVKEYRRVYGDSIDRVLLYGSYARGDETDESDVDIVAIVHGEREHLQEQIKEIWDVSAEIGVENDVVVSPTVIPYEEYIRYKDIMPYYRNISREGIVIG